MSTENATSRVQRAAATVGARHGATAATWFNVHEVDMDDALAILDDAGEWLATSGNAPTAPIDVTRRFDWTERTDALAEIGEEADLDGDELHKITDEDEDAYRVAFVDAYTSAIVDAVTDHLRGTPIPAALYVDGEPERLDDPDDVGTVHLAINEEGTAADPQPLSWCNSAAVTLTHEQDEVQVSISVGDPRGAFVMSVRRIPAMHDADGNVTNPDLAGRLMLYVPHPEQGFLHMPLTLHHDGAYVIGER